MHRMLCTVCCDALNESWWSNNKELDIIVMYFKIYNNKITV